MADTVQYMFGGKEENVERETISLVEAGQILGIGRSTAYELARQGKLPVLRLGRKLLVPRVALKRMLAEAGQATNQNLEEKE